MTPQLTEDEIVNMRTAYTEGATIHELAGIFRRSLTTITKHTIDLRPNPAEWDVDIAPDNPDAETWQERAACRGVDFNIFFPGEEDWAGIDYAKRYCEACPVRTACLQYALDTDSKGIFGGTTDKQRRYFKRGRNAA